MIGGLEDFGKTVEAMKTEMEHNFIELLHGMMDNIDVRMLQDTALSVIGAAEYIVEKFNEYSEHYEIAYVNHGIKLKETLLSHEGGKAIGELIDEDFMKNVEEFNEVTDDRWAVEFIYMKMVEAYIDAVNKSIDFYNNTYVDEENEPLFLEFAYRYYMK